MTTMTAASTKTKESDVQLVTFRCGDMLVGVDIDSVQEINRQVDITEAPEALRHVRGAINLRGAVVTVVDLRAVLGMPSSRDVTHTRNVIVRHENELIGLLVDAVSNIITIRTSQIESPPANVNGVQGRFFQGVYTTPEEIIVVLDIAEALGCA